MASSSLCFVRSSPVSPPPLGFSNGVRRSCLPCLSHSKTSSGHPRPCLSYKMKTHKVPSLYVFWSFLIHLTGKFPSLMGLKASAKRFHVTGRGKIVRRRAGKQHLLAKKNTKRKLRLSKMLSLYPITSRFCFAFDHPVNKSDYDNVIGALPYLKVNRHAT
ncbi:unnamed protein product [Musa acuminata subsp. burmannicoides]